MAMKRYHNPMGAYTIVGSKVVGPDEDIEVDTDWGYDCSLLEEIKEEPVTKVFEPVKEEPETEERSQAKPMRKSVKKVVIDDKVTEE